MSDSGIDDFPRVDDDVLGEGMGRAAALGLPVAVHAEDERATRELTAAAREAGRAGPRDWLRTRPVSAELDAIRRAVALAAETGCALHVVHVSSAEGVMVVAEARTRGADVTCETCPHYLVFTEEDLEAIGALLKCSPPVRAAAERDALRTAVAQGLVDTIGSDHSPSPPARKQAPDFFDVWGGISGCQTLLVATLDLGLDPALVSRLTATAPAARLGLAAKGSLTPGADADLVVVSPVSPTALAATELHYRHRHSPYLGRAFAHRVERTILRGRTVWDGESFAQPTGRIVRRA
jgi:allantoinase